MNSKKEEFFKNGFLILDSFNTPEECDKLIERARQLSESLKGQDQVSLFQTSNQSKASNDYFLASGDNISYFFENDDDILVLSGEVDGEACFWKMKCPFSEKREWSFLGKVNDILSNI